MATSQKTPRKSTSTRKKTPPLDPVTRYARAVVDGDILAGPHVRAACARHLDDLINAPARGFHFDIETVERVIGFYKDVLRLNGGEFENVPYELLDWQAFIVGSVFGWKNKSGYRRFRVAYVETAKGSGKSPLAAGVGLYGMLADKEARAEIYAAATKKEQAMVLFRDAVAMVDQSPALSERMVKSGVGQNVWNLAYHAQGSFFRPISADNGASGPRPHIALLDEIHEHPSGHVVEMLRAGTKGRRQALMFMITNSGSNKQSVCGEYHDYGAKVAAQQVENDSFFAYICALDEDDDPFNDKSCWKKANPSLGITIQEEYLQEQINEALGMPSKEAIVKRLNFCQWTGAENPFVSEHVWKATEDDTEINLYGRRCWGGLDLASSQDLAAFVLLFEPDYDDPFYRMLFWFWLPEDGLVEKEKNDRVPYHAWKDKGYLNVTPGKAIDKKAILFHIAECCSEYDVQAIGYDRWRIKDLLKIGDDEGVELPLKEFGQGYKDMAPAVDEFERLLTGGQLRRPTHPVMTWCAANAVVTVDPANNKKLDKSKSRGKIDGMVAAVMAAGSMVRVDENEYPVIGGDYEVFSV